MKFNKYLLLQTTALRYKYQDSLNNLIANLVLAWLFSESVAISRNRNTFSDTPRIYRPEHYSYFKIILSCLNQLVAAGYVNQTLGFYNNALGNRSKLTRIELTDKLLNEIQLQEPEIKFNHKLTTPLILKDKKKKLITYPYTDQTSDFLKFLNSYNEFSEINAACLEVKNKEDLSSLFSSGYDFSNLYFNLSLISTSNPLNNPSTPILRLIKNSALKCTFDTKLRRVFNNGNFDEGGRFYSSYQNLKKEKRKELKLNGFSTVEIDFKYLHPKMLYHLAKLDCQDDPYSKVDGFERKEIKTLFQILLNSEKRTQALKAGVFYLKRNPEVIKRAFNLLEDSHPHISKHFYSGIGIQLQRKDSALAEGIMSHFMERNIAILAIHDSFIVPEHHQSELADAMKYYYQRDFNYQPGLSIN